MSWILSSRNLKRSIYCDGHGGYLVIKHDRGICNEKIVPPFATKKAGRGSTDTPMFQHTHLSQQPPIHNQVNYYTQGYAEARISNKHP